MSADIPQGWHECRLEDCVEVLDSLRVPVNNDERQSRIEGKPTEQLFPYYGATGQVGFIDDFLFDEELVALGEDGVPFLDPLKSKAYMLRGKTWVNNHAHVLRSLEGVAINKFVFYYLNQFDYQGYVNGGTRLKLTQANMRMIPVPLPPLAEQTRIAAKLDELLAQVDTLKARIDGIPALLKRFRQSVLAAAVSGRLTEEWRAQHVGWVDEGSPTTEPNRNTESWTSQAQPNLQSELPAGWYAVPLGRYAINHDGARKPISAKERESRKGEHPYYGATGQIDSIDGYTHDGEFVLVGEDGANLLTRAKPIAFIAKGQIWVNNHAHVIASPSGHSNAYLAIYLNTLDITPWVSGSAQPKLNQKNMNEIPVHVPPLAEQTEIVRRVEQLFVFADQLEAKVASAKSRIDHLTQSILAKAFRGELVPQDPSDEPASLLLERIKAQRTAAPKAKRGRKVPA